MKTVGDLIEAQGCSTAPVRGLSLQIIDEMNLLIPSTLVTIDDLNVSGNDEAVNLFLQPKAKDALRRAIASKGTTLKLNSVYRTVVQQHMLYSWQGSCGIQIAAKPGRSNHEDGFAIDTPDWNEWKSALQKQDWEWFGEGDLVHFTYVGGGVRDDVGDIGVKGFQRLWNKNNTNDQLLVDGNYGPETAKRLDRSPAQGFPRTRILKLTEPPMQGEDVRQVQQALVAVNLLKVDQVDGVYGTETELAVENFQRQESLAVDGQVGPATRKALKLPL